MVLDRTARLALEVEVDMLRHVDRRLLVGHRLVVNAPDILRRERVRHLDLDLARETLVTVGRSVREDDANVVALHKRLCAPDIRVPAAIAAVEVAADASRRVVEGRKLVGLAVHLELALRDTVAVAADERAPVGVAIVPAGGRVKADDDILHLAFLVRREKAHNLPAVVAHFENDATRAVQDVLLRLLAVLRHSEVHNLK